ncbi:RTA-like protein [Fusarium oxysporum f. sp. vasinfectum]|nr:RTA-like protein [Fusarium oxysporum f. sp. vasinfectum]
MANETQTPKGYAPFDLYPYNPSQGPAYAFLGLFGAAGIAHFIMMFPYRAAFPIPMIIGCGMEAAAYWFRSRSHDNLRQTLPFLIQNLLVLVAPPFLAATIYMSLGRITRALKAQEASLISLRWITKLFVLVDLICFATQTAGAIMSGSEDLEEAKRGQTIIIGGLVLQILAFALFIICTLTLQIRLRSNPPVQCVAGVVTHYRRYFIALYCTSGLFLCDEVKPQCGKCVQFGVWCDYSPQPPGPQVSLNHQPDSQSRRPGRPRSDWTSWAEQIRSHAAESVAESPGHLNTMDLELFHSYMTRTASTLGDGSSLSLLWSEEYAPIPSGDTPEHNAMTDPILMVEDIEDWRSSLNGISHLIAQLAEEKLGNVYDRELQALTACFESTFRKGQDAALYTVGKLQDVIGWVYRLGDDYMEGLRQRDLISTVMLGHFCVLLRTVEAQFWFMHEWAAHIIGEILVISPNSRQWLSWPIAYVNPEQ